MMLAADLIVLASRWIHREREMFSTPEGKALLKEWGLPDGLVGIGSFGTGVIRMEIRARQNRGKKAIYV